MLGLNFSGLEIISLSFGLAQDQKLLNPTRTPTLIPPSYSCGEIFTERLVNGLDLWAGEIRLDNLRLRKALSIQRLS